MKNLYEINQFFHKNITKYQMVFCSVDLLVTMTLYGL